MNSSTIRLLIANVGLLAAAPAVVDAQVAVDIQLHWESADNGWHAYRPVYVPARAREVVYSTPRARVHVPPGHLPPPGSCRRWYPGVPPGHQPPPEPCERLFRYGYGPDFVIIGSPHDAWDVEYRDRPGRGRGRDADWVDDRAGRGRGRGRR
jgi:hypothetical protein